MSLAHVPIKILAFAALPHFAVSLAASILSNDISRCEGKLSDLSSKPMMSGLIAREDSQHEIFLSLAGMEGLESLSRQPRSSIRGTFLSSFSKFWPGVFAAAIAALAARGLAQQYDAPVMLLALLLGIAFGFLYVEGRCAPGIEFASRSVLRFGVALLGARITLGEIWGLGVQPIAVAATALSSTILIGTLGARALKLNRSFGLLSGGAVGICGASAALAIASVLPRDRNLERETILVVITVTALSTLAMVTYPLIVAYAQLDHVRAGIFLGGSIHDVAQVVGAGYMISPETGDVATYVKLLRVLMLLPAVFVIASIVSHGSKGFTGPRLPMFLVGFACLAAITSTGGLPAALTSAISDVSSTCLLIAIAALGMKTSLQSVMAVGWRPVILMVVETLWIGAVVLAAVMVLN